MANRQMMIDDDAVLERIRVLRAELAAAPRAVPTVAEILRTPEAA